MLESARKPNYRRRVQAFRDTRLVTKCYTRSPTPLQPTVLHRIVYPIAYHSAHVVVVQSIRIVYSQRQLWHPSPSFSVDEDHPTIAYGCDAVLIAPYYLYQREGKELPRTDMDTPRGP